jgi:hypothetical protein
METHGRIEGVAADRTTGIGSRRSGTACRGARHVAGIKRLAVKLWPGSPGLMLAPLATVPAVEDLAADRAPGLGPGQRHGTSQARRRGGGPL